jgi:hypothetical protein
MTELRTVLEGIEEQISARPDSLERVFLRSSASSGTSVSLRD